MLVADALKRNNNNFHLLRIICALGVVFAHSYYLADAQGAKEPLESLLPFTYTGSLAVKIFFFISGLLVTNSLMRTESAKEFIVSRFFRIYPALFFFIIITALIIVPLVSSKNFGEYFSDPMLSQYLVGNLTLNTQWYLPGAFESNILKGGINGTLWSIPYEVYAYSVLLSVFLLFGIKNRLLVTALCVVVMLLPSLKLNTVLFINNPNADIVMTAPCFALGVLMAINQKLITISIKIPIAFAILYFAVNDEFAKHMMFYFSACTLFLYIFTTPYANKFQMQNDISYGVYLWGFLVAQIVYKYAPGLSLHINQLIVVLVSAVVGYISYILIEKPSMALSKRINSISLSMNNEKQNA